MRNLIPCPSPNGTNYECLYILREPTMAMDAAPDPDPDAQAGAPDAYEALCTFLASHLDPNDLGEAEALLRQFLDQTGGEVPAVDERGRPGAAQDPRTMTMDERVAVGAKIRAGKALAQLRSFNTRFPGAARIRNV
jgi:hypothetical protein